MQPASGARDLNPRQVEINHLIATKLASVYNSWGYEEVAPPNIERIETLMAGDAISNKDIVKVVADDSLGLRPELTTSIARAASTRLINRPRPLRLWTQGTVFESKEYIAIGSYIEESLQTGVELFGIKDINAEIELLSLLLDCLKSLQLDDYLKPTLLIGHKKIMDLILNRFDKSKRKEIKSILSNYDKLSINKLMIGEDLKNEIHRVNEIRGEPNSVLDELQNIYGDNEIIRELSKLFKIITPISINYNVEIQLDPTFQANYDLYNGIIFQLVCNQTHNNIVIAKGGRYDKIIETFNDIKNENAGLGFTFDIDKTRDIFQEDQIRSTPKNKVLIAFSKNRNIKDALEIQRDLHLNGQIAVIELSECENRNTAMELLLQRKFNKLEWLD